MQVNNLEITKVSDTELTYTINTGDPIGSASVYMAQSDERNEGIIHFINRHSLDCLSVLVGGLVVNGASFTDVNAARTAINEFASGAFNSGNEGGVSLPLSIADVEGLSKGLRIYDRVLFVDDANTSETEDGSSANPFKSLTNAITFVNNAKSAYRFIIYCLSLVRETALPLITSPVKVVALYRQGFQDNFIDNLKVGGTSLQYFGFENFTIGKTICSGNGSLKFKDCTLTSTGLLLSSFNVTFIRVEGESVKVSTTGASAKRVTFLDCQNIWLYASNNASVKAYNTTFVGGSSGADLVLSAGSVFHHCTFSKSTTLRTDPMDNVVLSGANLFFWNCLQLPTDMSGAASVYVSSSPTDYAATNYSGGATVDDHLAGIDQKFSEVNASIADIRVIIDGLGGIL